MRQALSKLGFSIIKSDYCIMQHIFEHDQQQGSFGYEILPLEKRAIVQQSTREIKECLRQTARTIWEIGKKLVYVRSQLESRQFRSWLKLEFGWSQRTAYNFINVYQSFPELANFAKIDISISALYLLAAPSTSGDIRNQFINRAIVGERITHKVIQSAITDAKQQQLHNEKPTSVIPQSDVKVHSDVQESIPGNTILVKSEEPPILYPISNSDEAHTKTSDLEALKLNMESVSHTTTTTATSSDIRPGWNLITKQFSLFWGHTASVRFIERLPQESIILAIPSGQWDHDWLLNKSRKIIIFHQSLLKEEVIENLLLTFCSCKKILILPWLPSWKIIALALKLNIKIYAGDSDLNKCEKAISRLN